MLGRYPFASSVLKRKWLVDQSASRSSFNAQKGGASNTEHAFRTANFKITSAGTT
uniref:Ahn-2 n=1 Tax=Steinernema carpocapsae TaxID=34508 RepID=A5H2V3_STECR|nr:Ahn-2 [Steinernema carpocapsae]ABQ23237.1 Ahn-3 [Steinernema carpocapsae]